VTASLERALHFTPVVAYIPKQIAFDWRVVNFSIADHPRTGLGADNLLPR
jgi:hypothetical protein